MKCTKYNGLEPRKLNMGVWINVEDLMPGRVVTVIVLLGFNHSYSAFLGSSGRWYIHKLDVWLPYASIEYWRYKSEDEKHNAIGIVVDQSI